MHSSTLKKFSHGADQEEPHCSALGGSTLSAFSRDESGMSTVEYIILLVIVVVGCVGVWNEIGGKIDHDLGESRNELNDLGKDSK